MSSAIEPTAPYVELHLHSNWSLLEGASFPEELLFRAKALGYDTLALTDHDGMFGSMEFAQSAKANDIRPIIGAELTMEDGSHLTLLAEDRTGYGNLCRLISIGRGHQLKDRKEQQARRNDPQVPWTELATHTKGLICLSGCSGRLPALVSEEKHADAERELQRLIGWFGPRNTFVELQDNDVFGDTPRNRRLGEMARRANVETVATGNVHYHIRERHRLHDVLTAIHHRKTLDESHRERRPNSEFFLRSPEEQARRFAEFPVAVANTRRIAERCRFDLTTDLGYSLPSPPVPEGHTPDTWLSQLCRKALEQKYAFPSPYRNQADEQLGSELEIVKKHGLAGFFLVYHDVLELAREVAAEVRGTSGRGAFELPPGRGRGSSVGSIICYLIGLSHIDPIKNRLFLGRFLNEEMRSLPDIDLDFPRDIRSRLIERVYEHWGPEYAALVASFPTYRIRSAIRDVGKALGLPQAELDQLAKRADGYGTAHGVGEEMARYREYRDRIDAPGWRDLVSLAYELAGFPRHLSEHVGGMVISSTPLIEQVPIQPAAWPGRYLCHWDKDSIDDARMVKIDFLALGMLSLVEECLDLIDEHRAHTLDLSRIDFNEVEVYDQICQGDTVGVFQIESRAQIQMLPRTQPRNLDDLAVQVAIVRPGPIVGGAVNPYVRRREAMRRGEPPPSVYIHESVHDILAETYGVVLFQEQVIQVVVNMADFTSGEAEDFRRAMSRKRSDETMERYRGKFMAGTLAKGVSTAVGERMFTNLLGFASFGFPKSHAAAFGLLAYQSAWLRRHYGPEFYCALFNNWPMGFYPPHVFTNDAKRHGVQVLRPDINVSRTKCTVENDAVRIGLGYVRGVGRAGGGTVEEARALGEFHSLFDFVHRTGLRKEAVENLIRVGAFDAFGLNQRELLWQLGLFGIGLQIGRLVVPRYRQLRLALSTTQDEIPLPDFTAYERMAADYELLSLSPDQHPMQHFRPALGEGVRSTRQLSLAAIGTEVVIAGLVVCRQRPETAKGIIFLLIEDEYGLANILVQPDLAEQERLVVRTASFVLVRGKVQSRDGVMRLIVADEIIALQPQEVLAMPEGKNFG